MTMPGRGIERVVATSALLKSERAFVLYADQVRAGSLTECRRFGRQNKGPPMHKPQDIPPVEVPPLDPTPVQEPIPHQNPQ